MQLEVVEVQRRAGRLGVGVGVGVVAQQLVEQRDGGGGAGVAAGAVVGLERGAVARRRPAPFSALAFVAERELRQPRRERVRRRGGEQVRRSAPGARARC